MVQSDRGSVDVLQTSYIHGLVIRGGIRAVRNKMSFNVNKCKLMHIGKKNVNHEYRLMGQVIQVTREEKDLGVFFSDTFKPSMNCNKVSKTANRISVMIRKNITNRSSEGMLILYKTLIRPVIDYCIPVWRPYTKKDMLKLEKVQKRFTKMIEGYIRLDRTSKG